MNVENRQEIFLKKKLFNATKWSTLTELIAKLITPISNIILARILVPEVFGIVASINMVISFCDVFSDAGFQKYVIQHETTGEEELNKISDVAFWTNFIISIFILGIVVIFSSPIAKLIGCEGYGFAVSVACILLPLHALSSIPNARLKREMDFKTLFIIRVVTIFVPFVVTLPLALLTRSYWSLICGNIASSLVTAIVTFIKLKWKPKLYFNFKKLNDMLSFSLWSMFEAILVWLINWGDIFVVGLFLSPHYLGIYKTSINMINSIIAVVSSSVTPVMLSVLSRLQDDDEKYRETFYNISFFSGLILIPMGIGILIYQDTICTILLGSAWLEGAELMGIWGLVSSLSILFNTYNGCVYISKGVPKISAIVQILQILFIIPTVYISVQISFDCLSYSRALIRIVGMAIHCIIVWKFFSISALETIRRLLSAICATIFMGIIGLLFISLNNGLIFELISIMICIICYLGILFLFLLVREPITSIIKNKIK